MWKSKLNYEQVETILIEIEGVLNSRPLCYVDDSDLSEPLTPSHLMYGRNIMKRNILSSPPTADEQANPSKRIRHVKSLLQHFWKRFASEYICSLRERDHAKRRITPSNELKVGDVVLVHQKNLTRTSWPLGKVTRLVSTNGSVRGAELRTETGSIKRPVHLLYPLEMSG